jgi:hypothetical protein
VVDGRVVATWGARRVGGADGAGGASGRLDVRVAPFGPPGDGVAAALDAEADDLAAFLRVPVSWGWADRPS